MQRGECPKEEQRVSLAPLKEYKGKSAQDLFADIVDRGLCTGCGTCAAVCPRGAISMVGEEPCPTPELRAAAAVKCSQCGICHACCPGERVGMSELEQRFLGTSRPGGAKDLLGVYLSRYVAMATDEGIRVGGASGGTAAALQLYALDRKLIDAVVGVGYRPDRPWVPAPVISRSRSEILATQGSKYTHCSVVDALAEAARQGLRVAVVGLPCHIHGVRKLQAYLGGSALAKSVVFTIGLFCAENRFTHGVEHIIRCRLGVPLDAVARISYREGAYPGAFVVWDKQGATYSIPYPDQLTFLWMHTRPRCRICYDYSAEVADISLGETQHLDKKAAHNAALVRTPLGKEVFEGALASGYIEARDVEERLVINHTGLERKKYANLIRIEWYRQHGLPTPDYPDASLRYEDLPPFYFGPKR